MCILIPEKQINMKLVVNIPVVWWIGGKSSNYEATNTKKALCMC
jgi:hypothetical protein